MIVKRPPSFRSEVFLLKFGHAVGDQLLKNTAQLLRETFRAADIIARIGGDEFGVLLPNTDSETAGQLLSRLRTKLDG